MKLLFISDTDFKGSGYLSITLPLCQKLTEIGHDVKLAGLFYQGEEHNFDFQILPALSINDTMGIAQHLYNFWQFDAMIVAMDIPWQEKYIAPLNEKPFKYIGIFPVEADPLTFEWGLVISQMDKAFIISEFGTKCAVELGTGADPEHLKVGIDGNSWRFPTEEEREKLREAYGFKDKFVVLTIADNQERKNLTASMDAFCEFLYDDSSLVDTALMRKVPVSEIIKERNLSPKRDAVYLMVTREKNPVGWKLRDYASELSIIRNFDLRERGLSFKELWALYACSDVFLLLSKAEGLGLPVMEAMATGVPVIGTDCTGIREQLIGGKGRLVPYEYVHRDPFGNGRRYWADHNSAAAHIKDIYEFGRGDSVLKARQYIEQFSWEDSAKQLDKYLRSVIE